MGITEIIGLAGGLTGMAAGAWQLWRWLNERPDEKRLDPEAFIEGFLYFLHEKKIDKDDFNVELTVFTTSGKRFTRAFLIGRFRF